MAKISKLKEDEIDRIIDLDTEADVDKQFDYVLELALKLQAWSTS